jgi:hypothetical protein
MSDNSASSRRVRERCCHFANVSANLFGSGAAPGLATNESTPTEAEFAVAGFAAASLTVAKLVVAKLVVAKLVIMAISRWSSKNTGESVPDFF